MNTPAQPPQRLDADWHEPIEWHNAYQAGVTEFHPGAETKEIRNMLHIVAYDIADPSRLRRVARTCEDYGVRVEKSLFHCDLTEEKFQDLWLELIDLVVEDEDAVVAYRVCQSCLRQTESMGVLPDFGKPLCYIL
jgi:CRISPR-associated protein Cas2